MRGSLVVRLLRGGGGDPNNDNDNDVPEEDAPRSSVCGGWDPNDVCHVLLAGRGGEIRSCDLARGETTARRFQLCRRRRRKGRTVGEEDDGEGEGEEKQLVPVGKTWRQVEMVPGRPGELLFVLEVSEKLLYVRLPEQDRAAFRFHPNDQDALHRGDVGRRDPSSGFSQVYQLGSHASAIAAFAVAPDGLLAASAGEDGSLLLWRLTDGALAAITALPAEEAVTAVAFERRRHDDEDGDDNVLVDTLVTGHKDGSVRLWRVPDEAHELYLEADDGVPSLQLQHTVAEKNDGTAVLCMSTCSPHHSDPTTSVDSSLIAVGFLSGAVQLWSIPTTTTNNNNKQSSQLLWSQPALPDNSSKPRQVLAGLALRKDGALLAVAYSTGLLQLHCLTEKRPAKCFEFRREGGVVHCAYSDAVPVRKPSPAAELLLVCTRTGPLRVVRDEELIEVASTPNDDGGADNQQQGSVVRHDEGGDDDGGGRNEDDNPVPQRVPAKLRVAHEAAVALASSLQQQQLQQRDHQPAQPLPPTRIPKPAVARKAHAQVNPLSAGDGAAVQTNIASERALIEPSQAAGALPGIPEEESISNSIAQSTDMDAASVQPAPCAQPGVLSSARVAARLQRAAAEEFDRAAALQAVGPAASVAAATAASRAAGPYVELKPIEEVQPLWAPKVIGKQLHPKWVASLEAKPSLEALWRPSDWEPEASNTAACNAATQFVTV
eukprot:jgi/Chlat1/6579/Chrsp45S05939